jgi:hypothetical protein
VARLALSSGVPVIPVGIYLQRDRLQTLKSVVSGKAEYSNWYLHGPYAITMGEPTCYTGDAEDRDYVRNVAYLIMLKIMRLAAESQQRWYRNNPPIPGALEIP